ncbi:amino acid ABC transporter permease [Vibrio marisflavi]|uniref:Glutamine transport system permease protein GlnP n=1 Tax=Vibrio marisflavi CECT 7928 TaxID=634439 RepID=A0ABM9A1D9_9VIBR|nr:amino acid ABC transporter permease [Vibrio marisflavi]CAH0537383.1 Glutamine transport system permease protein GlnP [Vibrio marisflavi CECT 7928]
MASSVTSIQFFSEFQFSDLGYLGQAAIKTVEISAIAIVFGTILGVIYGWLLSISRYISIPLGALLDVFRSVPLIIQLVLFYNFVPIIGFSLDPFDAGALVLAFYTSALVANVARGGIESVPSSIRNASRSLGMSYFQDIRYIVLPIGVRTVLPAWTGIALGVLKDSALVSVLGYVELLRASQILITRTQEPFIILSIVAAFYFALSYPISLLATRIEKRWKHD